MNPLSQTPEEKKERKRALEAITCYNRLKALGLLSEEEVKSIMNKMLERFRDHISPLRND